MDPNLFHLDYERLGEVLSTVVVLSFFLERALSIIFEHRFFIARFNELGLKAPIAFLVALAMCRQWQFDAISMTVLAEQTNLFGYVLTAGLIAGGSKASLKFFHEVLNSMSPSERERKEGNAAVRRQRAPRSAPAPQPIPVPVADPAR
jgi:hypothetical protein